MSTEKRNTARKVVVLAGPNGAGKSTSAARLLRGTLGVDEFVNADVIAQGISGFAPDRVAMAAGRVMMRRIKQLASEGPASHSKQRWRAALLRNCSKLN